MAQRATKKEAKGGVNVVQSRPEDVASPAKENRSVMAKSRDEMLNNVLQTLFKGANTNSDSVEFCIPQLQDESQLIAVAPAVVIPIGIGAYKLGSIVLVSVGAAGTIIYWEEISGQGYGFWQIVAIGIEMFGNTDAQEQIDDLVDWDDD